MRYLFFILTLVLSFNQIKAQNYDFGKVSKEELKESYHPKDSSTSAAIIYRNENINFYYTSSEGFMQQREVHERIKIYNKDGFDWATKKVYLYQGSGQDESVSRLKGFSYNLVDGKIVKDKLKSDGKFEEEYNEYTKLSSFTLPNVKEGTVIEYRYTINSPSVGIDDIIFQYSIPINKLEVRVSTPEYYIYNQQLNLRAGYLPKLVNSSKNTTIPFNYKVNMISADEVNIPALKEEAFAGNINNYRSKLSLEISAILNNLKVLEKSFSNTWEQVSKTIYKSENFGRQLNRANFYKDDLDILLKSATSDFEKAVLVQQFVKSKVRWNGNNGKYAQKGVRSAYKEGEGNAADINLLVVSMLQTHGVNANPVLVSTRNNGIPMFPTREGFNYVVCIVESDNKQMLIDATEKYSSNNVLPYRVLNWKGLKIERNGATSWVELKSNKKAVESTMLNVIIENDFSLTGKVRKNYTSHLALNYRKKHNDLGLDEKIKAHESGKDGIEISEYNYNNEDDLNKPARIEYDFELTDGVDEIGDKIYFNPLLFFTSDKSPFKLEERQYPIDFIIPMQDKFMVNIQLPEGYKVESLPESEGFSFNNGQSKFVYRINESGNFIRLNLQFDISNPMILPSDYKIFKDYYNKYIEKQAEQIVLTKA